MLTAGELSIGEVPSETCHWSVGLLLEGTLEAIGEDGGEEETDCLSMIGKKNTIADRMPVVSFVDRGHGTEGDGFVAIASIAKTTTTNPHAPTTNPAPKVHPKVAAAPVGGVGAPTVTKEPAHIAVHMAMRARQNLWNFPGSDLEVCLLTSPDRLNPQLAQNFACSGLSAEHLGQVIASLRLLVFTGSCRTA